MIQVVIVDENDNKIGLEEKIEAHRKGLLHRAFSGFVFNKDGQLLIQQRDLGKYHNPGIWANTICSHPFDEESYLDGVTRRVEEELGFECTDFKEVGEFIYKVEFDNGLTEHEYDHVFIGHYDGQVKPNPEEVMDYKWIALDDLEKNIENNPNKYSYWLKEILKLNMF